MTDSITPFNKDAAEQLSFYHKTYRTQRHLDLVRKLFIPSLKDAERKLKDEQTLCHNCGSSLTRTIDSHLVPKSALGLIAEEGSVVCYNEIDSFRGRLPSISSVCRPVKKAGVFNLICVNCEKIFANYEECDLPVPTEALKFISKKIDLSVYYHNMRKCYAFCFMDKKHRVDIFDKIWKSKELSMSEKYALLDSFESISTPSEVRYAQDEVFKSLRLVHRHSKLCIPTVLHYSIGRPVKFAVHSRFPGTSSTDEPLYYVSIFNRGHGNLCKSFMALWSFNNQVSKESISRLVDFAYLNNPEGFFFSPSFYESNQSRIDCYRDGLYSDVFSKALEEAGLC